ncbi:MAG TPA: OmpW family outer membrane protein [Thermoanaerobaculia bacterium]|nr:OmpW family outer membrane protein [Thermoanaerobaculia bacterium]
MKKPFSAAFVLLALLALLAPPAAAQVKTEIGAVGTWIHSTSTTVTDPAFDIGVKLENGGGGGLLVDVRPWKIVSFEISGFFTRQSAAITASGSTLVAAGRLDATPVVLVAKFHFLGDGAFDPWVGGGETYVFFQNLHDAGLDAAGIGVVTVKGKAGLVAAAGFRVGFSPHVSFLADGRYLAVRPDSEAASGSATTELKWNPILVSAGFGFRF